MIKQTRFFSILFRRETLSDIRFWILLFCLIRLYGITNPPLETAHNWRQTTVTMVARNFLETDNNILYPRIDIAGEKTGITGMEFPLLNYLIYLISLVFGYAHWYGRLINLVVSGFGTYFFFLLLRRIFDHRIAFFSALILLSSIWFAYSRKIMPDTFSVSLVIAGLYYASRYLLDRPDLRYLVMFSVFSALGVLSKLPAAILLPGLAFFLYNRQVPIRQRVKLSTAALLAILPSVWWYGIHVPFLVEKYGFWHFFMGKDVITGIREIFMEWPETLRQFYENALKFSGFLVFLLGLFFGVKRKQFLLLSIFLLIFLTFLLVIFKAGHTFPHHSYYIIPFVPVMALVAGFGVSCIPDKRFALAFVFIIALEGILNQQHDFRLKPAQKAMLNIEKDLDSFSGRNDLILINSDEVPTPVYFAHRKGWVASNDLILKEVYLDSLQQHGLKYIIILKKVFGSSISLPMKKVLENENYIIYSVHTEL